MEQVLGDYKVVPHKLEGARELRDSALLPFPLFNDLHEPPHGRLSEIREDES